MNKLKCSVCNNEFQKEIVSIECPTCYMIGFDKEKKKLKKKIVKIVNDRIKEDKSIWIHAEKLGLELNKLFEDKP